VGWVDDDLVTLLRQLLLMADLLGRASMQARIETFDEEIVAAPEALAYFRKKLAMTAEEFDALDYAYRDVAFTVARVDSLRIISQVKRALQDAIAQGTTMAAFVQTVDQIMDEAGMSRLNPRHVQTVFRTNTASAFMAGRMAIFDQLDEEEFPLWEYQAILDDRVRPTHAILDGVRMTKGEFMAARLVPPLGFNCRCSLSPVHRSEGLSVKRPPAHIVVNDKVVTVGPDPGFGLPVNPARLRTLAAEAFPELAEETRPRTMTGLRDTVQTYQMMQYARGYQISPVPEIVEVTGGKAVGFLDPETYRIRIRSDQWDQLKEILTAGEITPGNADAWHTLVHEIGHSVGPALDMTRYEDPRQWPYLTIAETINELWARITYREMAYRFGIEPLDAGITLRGFGRNDYTDWVERLIELFETAGLSRAQLAEYITKQKLEYPAEEYSRNFYQLLAEHFGVDLQEFIGLPPIEHSLRRPHWFEDWKDELDRLRRRSNLPGTQLP
jgi:SPP1 gp7 family putative phage head morphogenesis protein